MTYLASDSTIYRRSVRHRLGLRRVLALWRSRRQLQRLEDHALADIGLTREQAEAEARRAIWDVPANWRA